MFANALKMVESYTLPVVFSYRMVGGQVTSSCATFIVLNPEGWVLTAAHVLDDMMVAQEHFKEIAEYQQQAAAIQQDQQLNEKQKQQRIRQLALKDNLIRNYSLWWGLDGVVVNEGFIDRQRDLAIGRLEPFDSSRIARYPVFKDPNKEMARGTSLCRLGYPFPEMETSFDETTGAFQLHHRVLTQFPNDGMFTRICMKEFTDIQRVVKLIETSSPGLRGQSGGPVFDVHGRIWGIQSFTSHFPLGFNPKVQMGNREFEEYQFLNVGLAVHIEEVVQFLTENKVAFTLAGE